MSGQLIFDENTFYDGNLFQFEERLKSHVNRFIEGGAILTTYFSQNENATTVDRGTRDIEQLFGKDSPLRFNRINNFPLYAGGNITPNNSDEQQIEDINAEGDFVILPSTIVPKPMDFFLINHLKMKAIFQVTDVQYDTMKVEGYYRIHYRLHSTSDETIQNMIRQTVETYHTELNSIGSNTNPIIKEEDFIYKQNILRMVSKMIQCYKALFYNKKHNCFLYHDNTTGLDYFDMCGNEFIAKYSLMNEFNSSDVIVLHDKLNDPMMPLYYSNSVYSWIELGAPARLIQRFFYILIDADRYDTSSFHMWGDDNIQIIQPIAPDKAKKNWRDHSVFDNTQFKALMDDKNPPVANEFEKLIWTFMHNGSNITLHDVSPYTADALISSVKSWEIFTLVPICIYIIRHVLRMN